MFRRLFFFCSKITADGKIITSRKEKCRQSDVEYTMLSRVVDARCPKETGAAFCEVARKSLLPFAVRGADRHRRGDWRWLLLFVILSTLSLNTDGHFRGQVSSFLFTLARRSIGFSETFLPAA